MRHTNNLLTEEFAKAVSNEIERDGFVCLARAWVDSDSSNRSNLDTAGQYSVRDIVKWG